MGTSYPDGILLHTYGGQQSDYNMSWDRQHGHQVTDGGLVLFNNYGSGAGSSALRYEIDGSSANLAMDYSSGSGSQTYGSVQALPNGNVLVTYSNAGVIHEVSSSGSLIQTIDTGSIGYSVRRVSLYGPPPPWGN